jgi:hypothetical protein
MVRKFWFVERANSVGFAILTFKEENLAVASFEEMVASQP